jgi:hypothetical protein
MPARHTIKMGLRGSVCAFGMPAPAASLAGVGRQQVELAIDQNQVTLALACLEQMAFHVA